MEKKSSLFDVFNTVFLIMVSLICVYPFLYIFFQSISDGRSIANGEVIFFPKELNLEAYKYVLSRPTLNIFLGLRNSFLYTVFGTIMAVFTTYITAFVLTRKKFVGRYFIMRLFVITWVFEAGIIPQYIIYSRFGLVNNPLVMIVPSAINVQFLIIAKNFLEGLPLELEEAAFIDGASDFSIMSKIYFPISKPIIATIGTFYAVSIWNQYLVPLIYLQNPNLITIQQVLQRLVISSGGTTTSFRTIIENDILLNPSNLRAASIFLAMLPIVIIYPFVQKYFKKGILIGSVK